MNVSRFAAALLVLSASSTVAGGAVIERTYHLPTSMGGPGSGWSWALEHVAIEPIAPAPGDTLVLHLQFDHRLLVQDIGPKDDAELIMVTLDTGASVEGGADALSFGTFSFIDARGALPSSSVTWGTDSGGFGIGAQVFTNLTDGAFSFSRLDVTWNLQALDFTPPSTDFRFLWTTFDADRVRVLPHADGNGLPRPAAVPEPRPAALLMLGLAGLGLMRRSGRLRDPGSL